MSQINKELSVQLKQGMRRLASGVCILTARGNQSPADEEVSQDGAESCELASELGSEEKLGRLAMTVSSVTSVSDDPPSLLVCVNKSATMASSLSLGDNFCINVLNQSHQPIANACAVPEVGGSRFAIGDWTLDKQSSVCYLKDSAATFFCSVSKVIEHGTHNIYIGNLSRAMVDDNDLPLLAYAQGQYHYL